MRVLIIGGTGVLGGAVVRELAGRHDVLAAARDTARGAAEAVDITAPDSIRTLFARVGPVDAVVVAAGGARWKPLADLTDDDFAATLADKLMGQVNVTRLALAGGAVRPNGSITLTSGALAQHPLPGTAAISLVNAGLEGFARAAALEAPNGIRVNVVSPGWVRETLAAMGRDPSPGVPAADVARVYAESVEGAATGAVLAAYRPAAGAAPERATPPR